MLKEQRASRAENVAAANENDSTSGAHGIAPHHGNPLGSDRSSTSTLGAALPGPGDPPRKAVLTSTLLKSSDNESETSTMCPRRQEGAVFAAPEAASVTGRPVGGLVAVDAATPAAVGGPPLGNSDEILRGEAASNGISVRTLKCYLYVGRREWRRALMTPEMTCEVADTVLKNLAAVTARPGTFYQYRRSLHFYLTQREEEAIAMAMTVRGAGPEAVKHQLDRSLRNLAELPRLETKEVFEVADRPTESKRETLRFLPSGWQEILTASIEDPYFRALVGFATLTGIRPAELQGRTSIERLEKDRFKVIINSVKSGKKTGQPTREFVLDKIPSYFLEIMDGQAKETYQFNVSTKHLDALRAQLVERSRRLFPRLKGAKGKRRRTVDEANRDHGSRTDEMYVNSKRLKNGDDDCVSIYCFRHALTEIMRMNDFTKAEIAGVLGHNSEATGKFYGNYKRGRNLKPPISIDKNTIVVPRKPKKEKPSQWVSGKIEERSNDKAPRLGR